MSGAPRVNWPAEAGPWGQGVGGKSQREPGLQPDPLPPRGGSQSGECISEPDSETQVLIKKIKTFFSFMDLFI